MNATTAAALSAIIRGALEIWATHANKPEGWKPTQQEWDDMLALNEKTPEDFYKEAAGRLGVPWPPVETPPPTPPLGD